MGRRGEGNCRSSMGYFLGVEFIEDVELVGWDGDGNGVL